MIIKNIQRLSWRLSSKKPFTPNQEDINALNEVIKWINREKEDRMHQNQHFGKIYNYNTVKVRCGVSRGKMFEEFYLSINSEGLPFTHSGEEDNHFELNIKNENTVIDFESQPELLTLPKGSASEAFGAPPKKDDYDPAF